MLDTKAGGDANKIRTLWPNVSKEQVGDNPEATKNGFKKKAQPKANNDAGDDGWEKVRYAFRFGCSVVLFLFGTGATLGFKDVMERLS